MHIKDLFKRKEPGCSERYFHVPTPSGDFYISDTGTCEECLREIVGRFPDALVTVLDEKGRTLKREMPLCQLLQLENNFVKRPPRELSGPFPIAYPQWDGDPVVVYEPQPEEVAAATELFYRKIRAQHE